MSAGRKSKYDPDTFPLLVEGLARDGLTEQQIADKLGVSIASFENYKNQYLEFLEALKRGKAPVDFEVENALLKRAKGYEIEEKRTVIKQVKIGKDDKGMDVYKAMKVEEIITKKHIPASETAQIFWLKNRKPEKWRDKPEVSKTDEDFNLNITFTDAPELQDIEGFEDENTENL